MALGKNARVDGRRSSSNYCSTVTLVVFVALCLVGVWMMTSSSVFPVQNEDFSSQDTKEKVKQEVTENDSRQFEDSSGDLPEDATKGDSNTGNFQDESKSDVQENQNLPEKMTENTVEENQEEKSLKENAEEKTESEEASRTETESGGDSNSESGEKESKGGENGGEQPDSEESSGEKKSNSDESDKKSETGESSDETKQDNKMEGQTDEKVDRNQDKESEQSSGENKMEGQAKDQVSNEVFPAGAQSEILNETTTQNGAWLTQAVESKNEKEAQQSSQKDQNRYSWKLCNVTAGPDYIPCLDNLQVIKKLPSTNHYEHRERHCPEEAPTCLVPLPKGYRQPIKWPTSREKIWYYNVPHTKLAEVKGHQNWVKVSGEYLTFPGGGTQFKHGALRYIDSFRKSGAEEKNESRLGGNGRGGGSEIGSTWEPSRRGGGSEAKGESQLDSLGRCNRNAVTATGNRLRFATGRNRARTGAG
ncbi:hypothetical protein HHK36_031844 [Tetracentron sinense]|uniref:Methyltransferase n=1 Tax=Tetracentron sinense TaxID=13715 RepID=A0A835CXP4_TETSI|nr:hypothetical protein HHK36_031844 [Tetracentron sinense]